MINILVLYMIQHLHCIHKKSFIKIYLHCQEINKYSVMYVIQFCHINNTSKYFYFLY